jgi:predicted 3-demethylubiquinone-9 3-methyltransferase (glyoxalase superfamily)
MNHATIAVIIKKEPIAMQKITTFLTFSSRGKEAVEFYVSIFNNSKINSTMIMPGGDQLLNASFSLDGQPFMAMDGGDEFKFALGTSLFVTCRDQAEVDYFWDKLTSDGGEAGRCGWLTDRFGVSWQIVPTALGELMTNLEPARAQRVMQAMLKMDKIDIADLEEASKIDS